MGLFDSFRKSGNVEPRKNGSAFEANPLENYEIQEPVERMVSARNALDEKAHAFLSRFAADEMFDGILDVDEEWRCWLEKDTERSCLFFDDTLEVFENEAYDYFVDHYSSEWKEIAKDDAAIDKMGQSLDEYKIFKTALYNVFNNKNRLPVREYYQQIYSRARDYNMTLERHSKDDFDLIVSFRPLDEVNRGEPYFRYELYMEFNPEHGKDGYVYAARTMDAYSRDSMYSGPVDLPIYGRYSKFREHTNTYFLSERYSLFYYEALKARRVEEKEKYNVPADYFEGTYIDTKKLIDVSEKSFRYGDSKIYIPKSQVAFAGDKLYMKRWLFYKLKEPIEEFNLDRNQQEQEPLENTLSYAHEKSGQQTAAKEEIVDKQNNLMR